MYSDEFKSRFFQKTIREGECLLWTGAKNRKGYGRVANGQRSQAPAHRVAWEIENGPFPSGMLALHSCDIPSCVNPQHIRPGTHQDNVRDREERGRGHRALVGTVCPKGHPITNDNIIIDGVTRRCRKCRQEYWAEREKRRARIRKALAVGSKP